MGEPGTETFDVAIVGAGPGGLMAALKSALLFHSAVILDKGPRTGRAFWIPSMDNAPGYPEGVNGRQLLQDLRRQIEHAEAVAGRRFVHFEEPVDVTRLERQDDGTYTLRGHRVLGRNEPGEPVDVRARAVVLATGVVDRQPYIGPDDHGIQAILPYANKGLAHYCLLCDGHAIRGQSIAILGMGRGSAEIAETLRDHFGASEVALVTCIPCATGEPGHDHERHDDMLRDLRARGIPVIDKTIDRLEGLQENRIRLHFKDGTHQTFDRAWMSLGWYKLNNELAQQAGALLDEEGYVRTTEDCEVLNENEQPIPGLFCVGDLRAETWNQVPITLGDAETAIIHAFAFRL